MAAIVITGAPAKVMTLGFAGMSPFWESMVKGVGSGAGGLYEYVSVLSMTGGSHVRVVPVMEISLTFRERGKGLASYRGY